MNHINTKIQRVDKSLVATAKIFASATLHEAYGKKGAVGRILQAIVPGTILCGPAITVSCTPGDNFGLHASITLAEPGDVLVATVNGEQDYGYWGDILTVAAMERSVSGLVIDGCVRDVAPIRQLGFPVYANGICIRGTKKKSLQSINHPITLGGILINPGDLVLGDDDGIIILAKEDVPDVLKMAKSHEEKEQRIIENLKKGKTTMELFSLDKILYPS